MSKQKKTKSKDYVYQSVEEAWEHLGPVGDPDDQRWWDGSKQILFYRQKGTWSWDFTFSCKKTTWFPKLSQDKNLQRKGFSGLKEAQQYLQQVFGTDNPYGFKLLKLRQAHSGHFQVGCSSTHIYRKQPTGPWTLTFNDGIPHFISGFATRKEALTFRFGKGPLIEGK